jgi:tetratricopeptide (TPR) repeat protein
MKNMHKITAVMLIAIFCTLVMTGCGSKVSTGMDALEDGDYDEAITAFQEAIDEEEDLDQAYRGLGLAYWEKEDYDNAREALENAVKNSDEELGTTYNMLACIDLKNGDYESALNYIDKAGNCVGNSEELTQELAYNEIICYEHLGEWDKAKEKMTQYQKNYPDDDSVSKDAEFLETR